MTEGVFFSCDWEYLEFYFLIAHISAKMYYKKNCIYTFCKVSYTKF